MGELELIGEECGQHAAILNTFPLRGGFDVVVSMSVVEYLIDTTCSFTELAWVLKPKEELIVQTLSKYDYVSFIAISLQAGFTNGYYLTFFEPRGRCIPDVFPVQYSERNDGVPRRGTAGIAEHTIL